MIWQFFCTQLAGLCKKLRTWWSPPKGKALAQEKNHSKIRTPDMEKKQDKQNEELQEEQLDATETTEQSEETAAEEQEETAAGGKQKKRKRGKRGGSDKGQAKQLEKELEELEADFQSTEEELLKTREELEEARDKYLRLFAEFDNYKKRTARERIELGKTASQDLMGALLPVIDDFERAFKAAAANDNEQVPEGVKLVHDKFISILATKGLKPMESQGQPFDPELHEALTKIPAPQPELKGKVVDTIEEGYYLNDKIIRYAKVVIGE